MAAVPVEDIIDFAVFISKPGILAVDCPIERAQVMKALKAMLDVIVVRGEGQPKRLALIQPAVAAVDQLMRAAAVNTEKTRVTFWLSPELAGAIRNSIPFLVEYQVLAEHDAIRSPKHGGRKR